MTSASQRSKDEPVREIRYSIRVHFLHRRLYRRIRYLFGFIALAASSSVIVEAIAHRPRAVFVVGLVVAATGLLDLLFDFAEHAAQHGAWGQEFSDLLARQSALTVDELDSGIAEIEGDAEIDVEALRTVAWNDTLKELGLEDKMRGENLWQKFVRIVA